MSLMYQAPYRQPMMRATPRTRTNRWGQLRRYFTRFTYGVASAAAGASGDPTFFLARSSTEERQSNSARLEGGRYIIARMDRPSYRRNTMLHIAETPAQKWLLEVQRKYRKGQVETIRDITEMCHVQGPTLVERFEALRPGYGLTNPPR